MNVSFDEKYHITQEEIIILLKSYDLTKRPIYRRLFNEVTEEIVLSFMTEFKITQEELKQVYKDFLSHTTRKKVKKSMLVCADKLKVFFYGIIYK